MLFEGEEDLRALPFDERRARLEAWYRRNAPRRARPLAAVIDFGLGKELEALWAGAREQRHRRADAEARATAPISPGGPRAIGSNGSARR